MYTIKDVAERAGVSVATVSRYMNGFPHISESARRRIQQAIAELNYRPNIAASGLVTKTTKAIGLMVLTGISEFFSNPFFTQVLNGISHKALSAHYDVLLSTSGSDEIEVLTNWIRGGRVDGIILLRSRLEDPAIDLVVQERFPAVLLGRPAHNQPIDYVDNDNVDAAYQATTHLIRLGHQRVAFMGGGKHLVVTQDRILGYQKALREYDMPIHDAYIRTGHYKKNSGYAVCQELLRLSKPPTAIVASDDIMAIGAMQAAHDAHLRVPDELSIVGFNDLAISSLTIPPLTSMRIHIHELGFKAADLLLKRIAQPSLPQQVAVIRTHLVVRQSTASFISGEIKP
ncbi:transcriptional regulator, LacI family [Sulfobacillus thermosulfidooxidans DSM 9293]|uniref:Transcriptional regulator, LacI family n=1 Tax=Sulfobacillus thermosulfidooxidans (strain DSM 9293 / VKM B-1269 / AT-1) TaxID=929705 RepID=A0A1W1WBF6_SULTA|nr:LacI family DNA-binding transcriptional regulator [Sulfobacillus thermosulfidooxidans]SMC03616.1 transcriptional regulator, LacI family [Sulfobacillus thermosulfidooxidans DSM 9293]